MLEIFIMASTRNFVTRGPSIHISGYCGHPAEQIYAHVPLALSIFGRTLDLFKNYRAYNRDHFTKNGMNATKKNVDNILSLERIFRRSRSSDMLTLDECGR